MYANLISVYQETKKSICRKRPHELVIRKQLAIIMKNWRHILELCVFSILLPSVDSVSDIVLGLRFLAHGHDDWGLSILAPVIANTLLTFLLWARREERKARRWTWILVVLQVDT